MTDLTGTTQRGYVIQEKIGEGGNGAIYKAHQTGVGRDVVIKVILPHHASKPEFIQRFETEAKLIAQLEHPFIVPLHDYWQNDDGAFLVMRWLRGGSLRDALNENPQWLLSKTSHLLDQITEALAVAHDAGVIHRDIKPENILLDERGNAYLTDFGIAKNLTSDSSLTADDAIVGTASYFAPEQIQSQPVSPATDIYSLGMMAYEMLAGEHAYGELSPVTLMMKHLQEPLPPLAEKRADIPTAIYAVLEKATTKDAGDRYATAPDFAEAFRKAMHPEKASIPEPQSSTANSNMNIPDNIGLQTPEQRNRARMLEKVQDFWISGVLNNSLHTDMLLSLGMKYQADAVERPWDMVLQQLDKGDQSLPEGIRITDVFYEMRGELLILGDPGSGKTTTLLELARDLIMMAQIDPSEPMPVVFNLSSWADNRKALDAWMIDELNTKYQIPTRIAKEWVESNQVLPLLDGLDEVSQQYRNACVEAINAYREDNSLMPMVVCSRIVDYQALSHQLKLQGAITLQPLTRQQVETYLNSAGDELSAVRAVLEDDEKLRQLVTSPLMLNIVTLAYRGYDINEIPSFDTLAGRREHLFDTYVDRMLKRRGEDDRYEPDKTKQYLTWLANQMSSRAQSVYHIENMQPNWLGSIWKRIQYAIGVRLFAVSLSILAFAVFYFLLGIGLSITIGSGQIGFADLNLASIFGFGSSLILVAILVGTVVGGVLGLILMTIIFFFRRKIRPIERLSWSWGRAVIGAIILALSFAVLSGTLFNMLATFTYSLEVAPITAPREFTWAEDSTEYESVTITQIDGTEVTFEIDSFRDPVYYSLWEEQSILYAQNWINTWADMMVGFLPQFVLIGLLTGGISGAVIGGWTGRAIDLRTLPNQGVRQSRRNFIRIGLAYSVLTMVTFFGAVIVLLPPEMINVVESNRSTGWPGIILIIGAFAPTIGLLVAMSRGGYVIAQHGTLRFLLWREKSIPLNISRFLDYASERVLMRKVGGGYIFIHRMLLEHFAQSNQARQQVEADTLDDYEPLTYRLEDKSIDDNAIDLQDHRQADARKF